MSMSEFEEQRDPENENMILPPADHTLPDDFSEDDKAFAQELEELFVVQNEQLPPYFVQTLLEPDDPRFQPIEHDFEYKTRARVFRRLKLRHRLVHHEQPTLRSALTSVPARRSLAMVATFAFVMFLTILFTAPSFASGLEILLKGAHTGVLQMHSYPKVHTSSHDRVTESEIANTNREVPTRMSLSAAEQQLDSWDTYWPQYMPDDYTLSNIYLYREPRQQWVDGPFIELDYTLTGVTPRGSGHLIIREFKLTANDKVLLVVKDGAAQAIKLDQNGLAQEIYVDGQWVMSNTHNGEYPVWQYGQRSELIYQRNGIVFWIVGDQRDGINEPVLDSIASSLQTLYVGRVMHMGMDSDLNLVTQRSGDANGPFVEDVVQVYPYGSLNPYFSFVGNGPQQNRPAPAVGHNNQNR